MPFTAPQTLTIEVTLADIAASAATALNLSSQNAYGNSLVQALKRLDAAQELPGQKDVGPVTQTCLFYAETSLRPNGLTLVSTCECFVCSNLYQTDLATSVIIAVENLTGVKPTSAYTVTLTKF